MVRCFNKFALIITFSIFFAACSGGGDSAKTESVSNPAVQPAVAATPAPETVPEEMEDEFDEMDYLDELYDKEPEELGEMLEEFINEKKWKKARLVITVLLEEDSEPVEWHFKSGLVYIKSPEKKYVEAVNEFEYVLVRIEKDDLLWKKINRIMQEDLSEVALKKAAEIHGMPNDEERARKILEIVRIEMVRNRDEVLELLDKNTADKTRRDRLTELLSANMNWDKQKPEKTGAKRRRMVYYTVHAINLYEKLIRGDGRNFWNYYSLAYLNYVMQFFASGLMALDRAMNVADTQEQVFFALQLQELLRCRVDKGEDSELDKLSTLDLSDDMIEEFLGRFSKDLNEAQMEKVRGVVRDGVKMKEKLENSESDREKLNVLRDFLKSTDELAANEELPMDIMEKIGGGREKTEAKLDQLEEQVNIKEDAVREDI
jgi:hypothetical protein